MTLGEGFLLVVRWLHSLAAVAWVGGSLFYVLVLRPAQRRAGDAAQVVGPGSLEEFRSLVDTCIAVLIVTGTVLLFDRLTEGSVGTAYVAAISTKIGLATWMFAIARGRWRRRKLASSQAISSPTNQKRLLAKLMDLASGVNLTVILGIAVFFLSDLLRFLFERGLTGR